ncbi:hypothetical protein CHS0354_010188 [Potamilus streckersoni]|uniref:SUEL-type lectin domain-containing protein n=1 Tax=Potamilus streckersoni TaxID=2493646 RepID=A0AAE0VJ70_9BIVA|nr:hypothetical protein CHS0354_010188 [Potamilus streckersoni]
MTEVRDEQKWNTTYPSLQLIEVLLLSILTGSIFHFYAAQIIPGTVDYRHWACVGNEGSYIHMDANCTSGQVIAVTAVEVGAKPNELACPKTVNSSIIFDPDTCCQPNQTNDCIFSYPISTLRSFCSGQTQCESSLAESMSLNDTSCNITVYGTKTSYMSLEYQCIEGKLV